MGIWGGGLERQLRRVAGLREGTRCARARVRACDGSRCRETWTRSTSARALAGAAAPGWLE